MGSVHKWIGFALPRQSSPAHLPFFVGAKDSRAMQQDKTYGALRIPEALGS